MNRESFSSHLGFILVSAGCAIGIGNVWKFPYITGLYGGGFFVLFYLLFLAIMGVPVMMMELSIGRATRKSIIPAYKALEKPGQKWHLHGYLALFGSAMLMMYYTTVSGWMVDYFFKFLTGSFSGVETEAVDGVFAGMLSNAPEMFLFMALTVILGLVICSAGLQNGLERVTKVMMVALLLLIFLLAGHSLLLPGSVDGLSFYLVPNLNRLKEAGVFKALSAAMNQAFFTLSLGIACIQIFGSYMSSERTLGTESILICILDTIVALFSGLIIFPACFSYGVQPDAGPSLIFITLPRIFVNMPMGRLWGTLFFLFMTFASFSTVLAVFENIISCLMEIFSASRKKISLICIIFFLVTSLPCVLGYNVLSWVSINGMTVLDMEDFLVSNLVLPIGSLITVLFCTSSIGWGFSNFLREANTGRGMRLARGMEVFLKYVLPVFIVFILIQGLLP